MSYQLRHREMGIYQGSFLGMGFWHPASEMPELGFFEFLSYEQADQYIAWLCSSECSDPLKFEDLVIEAYDRASSEMMRRLGLEKELAKERKKSRCYRDALEVWDAAEKLGLESAPNPYRLQELRTQADQMRKMCLYGSILVNQTIN